MCSHVLFKVLRLPAALVAHRALEGTLVRVHAQMNLVVAAVREGLVADLALVWHVGRMRFHVPAQFRPRRKLFTTHLTLQTTKTITFSTGRMQKWRGVGVAFNSHPSPLTQF